MNPRELMRTKPALGIGFVLFGIIVAIGVIPGVDRLLGGIPMIIGGFLLFREFS